MKIAFLDRDGTIISDYPDVQWEDKTEPEFLQGAIDALKVIREKGYEIIVITNQYLIGEGFISQERYDAFNDIFLDVIKNAGVTVLDVFYCPHSRNDGCDCCKPKPGLINNALSKYPQIDLKQSFLVGDSKTDIILGNYFELRAFGINLNACGLKYQEVKDLKEACQYI